MTEYNKMLTGYKNLYSEVVKIIDDHDRYFKALIKSLRDELAITRAVLTSVQQSDINESITLFN